MTAADWQGIHAAGTVFDLHAHPSLKLSLVGKVLTDRSPVPKYFDPFSVRSSFLNLKLGGVDILGSAIHVPERELLRECGIMKLARFVFPGARRALKEPAIEVTLEMIEEIEKVVSESQDPDLELPAARVAHSVTDLDEILSQGDQAPLAIVHTVEGAHSLDKDIANLDELFDRGVAILTLTHFYDNGIAPPVFPFPEYVQKLGCFTGRRDLTLPLSSLGIQLVERMIELGVLVDVTHCTPAARAQVYDIVGTKAPIIASHVGSYAINPNPYNLEDREAAKIADSGGVIGVIFMNYWLAPHARARGIDFISQTIRHFMRVAGEDHVAIGSDFDGFTDPPDDLKDASELPFLTQRLLSDGLSLDQVSKVLGQNNLRVIREGWGKK